MDDDAARLTRSYAQLLSLAVHEFRTPISVVGGYLRMLQRDTESPLADRHRKMVEEAEKSCARISALIAELSDISKLDDQSLKLQEEPLDLFVLVHEAAGAIREAADRGVRLQAVGLATGAMVKGDAVRLRKAIESLLRAVMREQPGEVQMLADCRLVQEQGQSVAVVIAAPEAHIASVYTATPAPLDEKRGGVGLEVPIARRIIERHGGRIWSPPSEKDGMGARGAVIISMPLTN